PELAAFRQRLGVRAGLEPLGFHEAADFVVHQLRLAGGRPEDLVSDEALAVLARGTGGVPRLLGRAAHQALSLAHRARAATVDGEAALEALSLLGLTPVDPEDGSPPELTPASQTAPAEGGEGEPGAELAPTRDAGRLRRLFAPPRRTA